MKRILLWAGLVVIGLCLAVVVTGMVLPREHRVRSCVTLQQPGESLYAVARDIGGTPAWWPELIKAERVDSGGRERWRETVDDFVMTLRVEEVEPGTEFHTLIEHEPGSPFGGKWIYQVSPSPVGNTLCITEEGWISNPAFRTIMALTGPHATLDSYLSALALRFGTSYRPEHL